MNKRMTSVLSLLIATCLVMGPAAWVLGAPGSGGAYTLGPGDSIEIMIQGDKDLTQTVTIKPDGSIDLALVGEVTAAGRTTSQLAAELTKRYSKYLIAPSITIQVHAFRTDHVYVLGQVSKPGEYAIAPGSGLLEALASAGGPTDRADLAKATVIREEMSGKPDPIEVNLLQAFAGGGNPDVKLQAGDVVYVPAADRRMVILGQVAKPGAYDLLDGQHVSDLLAAGGGPTPQASPQHAFIIRGADQIPVDVRRILAGDMTANLPLKAGDTLVVPESQDKVAVLGSVNKPGKYDLADGMKLTDAIALAGGQTDAANTGQVAIVRLEAGKTKTIAVDLGKAISGKDASQNLPLQSGDIVYVPERGVTLAKAAQVFSILGVVRIFFGGPIF
jgi:polysaccharide biosynthesis/export protein